MGTLIGIIVFAIVATILLEFVTDPRLKKLIYAVVFIICLLGILSIFVPGFERFKLGYYP